MVLIRALTALLLVGCAVTAAGCGESLFDAHGGGRDGGGDGGGGDGDIPIPATCEAPCLANAAADFDGSPNGRESRWRYLDDRRNRTWMEMTDGTIVKTGADQIDKITSCAEEPAAAECQALNDALLITSGGPAMSDPALGYKSPVARVIQLTFHAHVPTTSSVQRVRLYRNSREDVLFTGDVMPGMTERFTTIVDALEGDRFRLALEPVVETGGRVAVHFFVSGPVADFPSACQLALSFDITSSNQMDDACDTRNLTAMQGGAPFPPEFDAPPFVNLDNALDDAALDLVINQHVQSAAGNLLDYRGDTTLQLWIRHDVLLGAPAWVFSDLDEDVGGGGLGIQIFGPSARRLDVSTRAKAPPNDIIGKDIDFPIDGLWHFLRVVHTGGKVFICLDGTRRETFDLPAGGLATAIPASLGTHGTLPASFDGALDDVRVFGSALPCEPTN